MQNRRVLFSSDFKQVSGDQAVVPILDRGFLLGDSIYEAMRSYGGKLPFIDEHYARLLRSADALKFGVPFRAEKMREHLLFLAGQIPDADAYVRLIITRGAFDFTIEPSSETKPRIFVFVNELAPYPERFKEKGVHLAIVNVKRNPREALSPEAKTGNYLNNVTAIMEAKERGADDAILLNMGGFATESTTSNLFIVKNGKVLTPPMAAGLLGGITRQHVLDLMRSFEMPCAEQNLTSEDIYEADEVFITSSVRQVMGVYQVDDVTYSTDRPVTEKVHQLYKDFLQQRMGS